MSTLTPPSYKKLRPGWPIGLLILTLFVGPILVLFAITFSQDVLRLKTEYPHALVKMDSVSYELRKNRPKSWVPLKVISRYTKWAIILSEDWSFYQHEGLDLEQIKAALGEMMTAGKFRGASTITQQLVKNLFLSEERTLWRKLNEAILTHRVEGALSKNQILETYLNVIEFGPGVYGIGNATAFYFRKSPANLNPRESAFLAMLLPSPKRYSVSFRKKKLTRFARKRVDAILEKLRMAKVLTRDEYAAEVHRKLDWEL